MVTLAVAGGITDAASLQQLHDMGFTEFHYVVHYNSGNYADVAAMIRAAGMVPILNEFNDSACFSGCGDQTAHFQALKAAGWAGVAGEGVAGDTVASAMNVFIYINYGGIVSEQQKSMYETPYNHPTSGGYGHADYIETYNNNKQVIIDSCIASYNAAVAAGSVSAGITIGMWLQTSYDWTQLAKNIGAKTILFWCGYDCNPIDQIIRAVVEAVKNGLPVTPSMMGSATGSGSASAGGGSTPVNVLGKDDNVLPDYGMLGGGQKIYYSGKYLTQTIQPRMKYKVVITNPDTKKKVTFDSDDTKTAAMIECSGKITRTMETDTFDLVFNNSKYEAQKFLKLNSKVKIWMGWENTVFNDKNYIFGGYISHSDSMNVFDLKAKCTVSSWDRKLTFYDYKIDATYQWVELGYLLKHLYEDDAKIKGTFTYANTGVVVDKFVAKNMRLSDAFSQILNALASYNDKKDIPAQSETTDTTTSGMGSLYGTPKAPWWDFWMDEDMNAWLEPLFLKTTNNKYYTFESKRNLYDFSREYPESWIHRVEEGETSKDILATDYNMTAAEEGYTKRDPKDQMVFTASVPFTPELNVFDNNVLTIIIDNEEGTKTYHMRLDAIAYEFDPVMTLTMAMYLGADSAGKGAIEIPMMP